ncbi:MAG: DnaJ domain-containing protein [Candidatus Anammoxibacter sp.]
MRKIWIFLLIVFVSIYFILPYDLIPDFFGLFGRIDDFVLIGWLIWFIRKRLSRPKTNYQNFNQQNKPNGFSSGQRQERRSQYNENSNKSRNHQSHGCQEETKTEKENAEDNNPRAILNVSRFATKDQIKKSYKELIKKYHPDKVAYLGDEFQKMAHKKMVNIQKAYETLMRK